MDRTLKPQFCELCNIELYIIGEPEIITSIRVLKIKFKCYQCKCKYSVTWNYHSNFYTKFKQVVQ
jgi:hypothetical protein